MSLKYEPASEPLHVSVKQLNPATLKVTPGESRVNLPQMLPDSGGICTGVDVRNHRFAPGLPLGWIHLQAASLENLDPLFLQRLCCLDLPTRDSG